MSSLTVADCLARAPQLASVSDTPRLDIEIFLGQLLQKNRTFLFTWPEHLLSPEQAQSFNKFFNRRLQGEPVAHIIGEREFWSLPLYVDNSTLIPRPDTELLVEIALELLADKPDAAALDLGTGTGAIILALAHEHPQWQCLGVDVSPAAIRLAEKNRQRLQLSNLAFRESHWFSQVAASMRFDVIVSNPPYIDPDDNHLTQGDVRFEPRSALVAEQQGLADLAHIIQQSPTYLNANGWLVVEHGYDQGEAVRKLFGARGFSHVETRCDYGNNERATFGCWANIR